jgi:hypothetical protein
MDEPGGTLELTTENTPLFGGVPLFAANGTPTWALLNLILAALGITLAMLSLLRRTIADNKEQENIEQENSELNYENQEEKEPRGSRKNLWLIIGSVAGVIGVILFIIFQDITAVMVWVDFLTIAHIALFAVGIVAAILATRNDRDKDDTGGELRWGDPHKSHTV